MDEAALKSAIDEANKYTLLFVDRSKTVLYEPPDDLSRDFFMKYVGSWAIWIIVIFAFGFILAELTPVIGQSTFWEIIAFFLFLVLFLSRIGLYFYGPFTTYLFSKMNTWILDTFRCPSCGRKLTGYKINTEWSRSGGQFGLYYFLNTSKCDGCGREFLFRNLINIMLFKAGSFILASEKNV